MSKPHCLVVTGRPGSGKTTLARLLAERLWLPLLSRDAVKEGYVNTHGKPHQELPDDTNGIVTRLFFDLAAHHLEAGVSLVVEAAFQHKLWALHSDRLFELAEVTFILCEVDADVAAQRHLQRGLDYPQREFYHGDQRVTEFRKTGKMGPPGPYEAPHFDLPTITVSTAGPYRPSLDELVQQLPVGPPKSL